MYLGRYRMCLPLEYYLPTYYHIGDFLVVSGFFFFWSPCSTLGTYLPT